MNLVRCSFYLRVVAEDGGYHYRLFHLSGYSNDGSLMTEYPPLVGDLVGLVDRYREERSGTYRVIERSWGHNQYGSVNWPITETRPQQPDMMNLVVVEDEGPFRNESEIENEEDQ